LDGLHILVYGKESDLDDLTSLVTAGTNLYMLDCSINHGLDRKEIRSPNTTSLIFCVTDVIAAYRMLSAKFTFPCHCATPSFLAR